MKPFPIAIGFHETAKKRFHLHSLACFWFPFVLLFLVSFPNVSDLLASFQPLAPAVQ